MKKATVLFMLIAISISPLFSQYRYYSVDEVGSFGSGKLYHYGLSIDVNPNQKITVTNKNKKGETKRIYTYQYNNSSSLIKEIRLDKAGKEKSKRVNIYDGKIFLGSEFSKKGNLKYKSKVTYDNKYRMSFVQTNAKGIIIAKSTNTFTEKEYDVINYKGKKSDKKRKKLTQTIDYKKGGEKQANKWVYEYDENGKQTVTRFYNSKNKVKYVWDYSCKEEGALMASKNQINFCKWNESEDGMLIEVTRKTSAKGEIKKSIKKYDADTNLVLKEEYIDGVLKTKVTYDKNFTKPLVWEFYKKGVLRSKYMYIYDKDGKVLNTKAYYKDMEKISYEEKYIYKDKQLVSVENYRKGKLTRSYTISYN